MGKAVEIESTPALKEWIATGLEIEPEQIKSIDAQEVSEHWILQDCIWVSVVTEGRKLYSRTFPIGTDFVKLPVYSDPVTDWLDIGGNETKGNSDMWSEEVLKKHIKKE